MGDSVAVLVTVGLVIVTVAMLAFSIVRLRRETRFSARTVILGAALPVIATIAYLVLGQPPFNPIVVGVVGLIGAVLGLAVAAVTRIDVRNGMVVVRQTGATLAIWTVVYVVTALAGFLRSADAQAVAALALAGSAGLAAGSQLGLFLRSRPRATQMAPAATFAWAGAPTSSASPLTYAPAPAPAPPAAPASDPAPTPAATPAPRPAPSTSSPALSEPVHFTHGGQRYVLGYTRTAAGIWDRGEPQTPLASYARTADGRALAWNQFRTLEPHATPVTYYPTLALAPIADDEAVTFTHVGTRFAIGRTATYYAIWDRWAPGVPVSMFGSDDASALQAWRTFSAWEPTAAAV